MPQLLADAAREFDDRIYETATKKMQLPILKDTQAQQLRLKLRNGGFGLPSTVETSPIAFAAAFISAHDVLAEQLVLGTTGLTPRSLYMD
jgi:hypothetical protein